jgi:hypothetical protein
VNIGETFSSQTAMGEGPLSTKFPVLKSQRENSFDISEGTEKVD